MATYTTAALAKKTTENFDASLADADIEAYIEEAESVLNAVMGVSLIADFDATDHGILRSACNAYAGYRMILFNPAGYTSVSEAMSLADGLWQIWNQMLGLVANKGITSYLESLV